MVENNGIKKNQLINDINNFEYEILRRSFKPEKIKVLFVAESPPPLERRTFFYLAKSGLYCHTRSAFKNVYGNGINPDFLSFFKAKGCYLDDLSSLPSNLTEIKKSADFYIRSLSERIKVDDPQAIVIVGRSIGELVKKAIKDSGILEKIDESLVFDEVPFAGNSHQCKYILEVELAMQKLIFKNVLD